jgi:thiol-disulfide isomerase/thioredoxin
MLRRLLLLGLMVCLWGCDDSDLPSQGRSAGGLSEEAYVAELLDKNVPFEFDFDLDDVNGGRLSKADFAGQVMIVDVWGTWCPPCREEIPHFIALQRQFGDQGLQIVGLNEEQMSNKEAAAQAVRAFRKSQGVDYPCALITQKVKRQIADFEGYPTTLFLDRTGNVRLKVVGAHDLSFLRAVVETLLKEKGAATADTPAEQANDG